MKTLNMILLSAILTASVTSVALAQEHYQAEYSEDVVTQFMSDPDSRSTVMKKIASDTQMRHQMMKNMMQTMPMDTETDMQKMMANPETKARMQKHISMMQAVLNSEDMSHDDMQGMMNSPEMKSMMKMHMMCAQMMDGEMMNMHSMGEAGKRDGQEHSH